MQYVWLTAWAYVNTHALMVGLHDALSDFNVESKQV